MEGAEASFLAQPPPPAGSFAAAGFAAFFAAAASCRCLFLSAADGSQPSSCSAGAAVSAVGASATALSLGGFIADDFLRAQTLQHSRQPKLVRPDSA